MIDPQAIQSLIELENSESFYFVKELEEIFQEQTPKLIQKMNDGVAHDDMRMVFTGAHTLKASCAYLGMTDMLRLCEQIEEWSQKTGRSNLEAYALIQALTKNYAVSKEELHKIISDIGSGWQH